MVISIEIVAIGGGSLLLLGQMLRTTKDIDLVALVENGILVSANPLPGRYFMRLKMLEKLQRRLENDLS